MTQTYFGVFKRYFVLQAYFTSFETDCGFTRSIHS